MKKSSVANLAKSIRATVVKHSPEILIGLGISGMIGATALAVKATPTAVALLKQKAHEEDCEIEDLTVTEKVKTCWKCYIPAAATSIVSAACIIGANSVNARRNAALAAAYTLSDSALREYREKVVETIGDKKEQLVRDKVAEERIKKNPIKNNEVILTEKGNTLCYDDLSGRYFNSDVEKIKKAVNELNMTMINDMYVSLNEFYDDLGLEHTRLGDDLGWRMEGGLIEIEFSAQVASDGRPCLVLDYNIAPVHDYWKSR